MYFSPCACVCTMQQQQHDAKDVCTLASNVAARISLFFRCRSCGFGQSQRGKWTQHTEHHPLWCLLFYTLFRLGRGAVDAYRTQLRRLCVVVHVVARGVRPRVRRSPHHAPFLHGVFHIFFSVSAAKRCVYAFDMLSSWCGDAAIASLRFRRRRCLAAWLLSINSHTHTFHHMNVEYWKI